MYHGDLKPENILILNNDWVISDFRYVDDHISVIPGIPSEHCEYTAPILRQLNT